MKKKIELSVISPCYNEEDNIVEFVNRVYDNLKKFTSDFEIILVDDGSNDNTWVLIKDLKKKFKGKLKAFQFDRNFGHQKALLCGIRKAVGKNVLTMDSDLQHPPELIPKLYNELKKNNIDLVSCERKINFLSIKYTLSKFFYYFFNTISNIKIKNNISDFKIFNRKVVNNIINLNEKNIFLRGVIPWFGHREKLIQYNLEKRKKGSSKIGLLKQFSFAFDGIFNFSKLPRKLPLYFSLIFLILFIMCLPFIIYEIIYKDISLFTLFYTFISFVLFLIFLFMCIITEYLGRILENLNNRPDYIIKSEL